MNYKSYQQVLDFAPGKKALGRRSVHPAKAAPKRRTKTGCLTCRSRKKKCDEETAGGKCQACIRNFLDCCWPTEPKAETRNTAETGSTSPESRPVPSPLVSPTTPRLESVQRNYLLSTPSGTSCKKVPAKAFESAGSGCHGASAYPSPVASPRFEAADKGSKDIIQPITLPPIKMKVQKPESHRAKSARFIVTSFDSDRALLQIKS